MLTINIKEFQDYSFNDVYSYLMMQNESEFEIIIPKEMAAVKDDNFSIFWEYYTAAYAGQRLNDIAKSFAYYVPSIYKRTQFSFQIEVGDKEKFADVLYFILTGYYNHHDPIDFHETASEFFGDAYDGKVEAACWGLLDIANRFLAEV